MTETNTQPQGGDTLSDAELSYFQTGGETEVTQEPESNAEVQEGQAAPEAVTQEQPEDQGARDEKGRFVPHGALHAEREEHKKTKAQLEEIARKQAVLEDRWNTLLQAGKQQEAPADDTPPDPNVDIFAYTAWQGEQVKKLQARLDEDAAQRQQMTQQQAEEREIVTTWQTSVQEFQTRQADFPDAAKYLSDLRSQQLGALGLDAPTINATIDAELKGVIKQAKTLGKSPAEIIYQYASVSGYKHAQTQQQTTGNVQMPDNLARVAAAQEASRTIASGSGRAGADPTSPEAIAAMSEKEFAVWASIPENARRFERMLSGT
jgi:hypothetical protein